MKEKFLIALILLWFVVSCSGGGIGGSQSDPKAVANAYLESIMAGDCNKAANYVAADNRSSLIDGYCGPEIEYWDTIISSVRIDDVIVRDDTWGYGWKDVTYIGEIQFHRAGSDLINTAWDLSLEEIDGKWYVRVFFQYNY